MIWLKRRYLLVIAAALVLFACFLSYLVIKPYLKNTGHDSIKLHHLKPQYQPLDLTFGGRTVLPDYRLVALYGTPTYSALGALGVQDLPASIARVKSLAQEYQPFSTEKVIPTFEIIVTVASASPTADGDYSQEMDIGTLEQWVLEAQKAGVYIILDLQPGRTDFLTQAKMFESLLLQPNVGLALDPEWRIGSSQVHLVQIGTVAIEEVNSVAGWLADLVKTNNLPQKVLVLHQFMLSMIQNRELLDTSRQEIGFIIHMDGQGAQGSKEETWRTITTSAPPNTYFGWKNFYQKDATLRSPADTMNINPKPHMVSYQ